MKPKTQKEAIKKHLIDFRHIHPKNALHYYGCFRLAHIILMLRKEGMDIKTIRTKTVSKFGFKCNFATYKLETNN